MMTFLVLNAVAGDTVTRTVLHATPSGRHGVRTVTQSTMELHTVSQILDLRAEAPVTA